MRHRSITILAFLILVMFLMGIANVNADTVILRPNAAGTYQEWTHSSTGHWQDTSDVSDSTYIYAGTGETGDRDIQDLADPTFSGSDTINSVTVWFRATVISGGQQAEQAATKIRTYSTDYEGSAVTISDSPTYTDYSTTYNTNPNTAGAWTKTEITNLQSGVILTQIGNGETVRCAEIWIVVDYTVEAPSVPEFPLGLALEIALIPALFYIMWKKRHRILQ